MIDVILSQLLINKDYFNRVWPYLNSEYFPEGPGNTLYTQIKKHVDQYNVVPTKTALSVALDQSQLKEHQVKDAEKMLSKLSNGDEDLNWLVDETERYVKQTAAYNATSRIIEIQANAELPEEKRNKKIPDMGAILDIMKEAISISFNTSMGHNWLDDYEERWLAYKHKAHKVPFKLNILNRITKGGVENATLNVLLAGVNCFCKGEQIEVYHIVGDNLLSTHLNIEDIYDIVQNNSDILYVRSKSGEIVPIRDTVKKTSVPCVEVSFPDHNRRVAATHRFSYKDYEVYAKDAVAVDTRAGIVQVSSVPIENQDVYDIMIDEPHWYTDQYGVIHHNTGKSMGLCSLASDYIETGKNVLYLSMEMSEFMCAKRIDANLLDITLDDLDENEVSYSEYKSKISKHKANDKLGRLEIKAFPIGTASAITFRAYINELKLKKKFVPDVIIVDYLGICASSRIKVYTENSYTLVKAIAEELRALAFEFNVPLWTAAQTTRGAWDSSEINMSDIAESAGLPATADFILAVIETEELADAGQQLIKQIKSRYGDKFKFNKFLINVKKGNQKWKELDEYAKPTMSEVNKIQKADKGGPPKTTRSKIDDLATEIKKEVKPKKDLKEVTW